MRPMRADGLAPRALEVVVELGILELREVERRGVLHEPHADAVGEEVAEQTFDEARRAREQLADDDDRELDRDEPATERQIAPVALRGDDAVDDQLPDPQRGDRARTRARGAATIIATVKPRCVSHTRRAAAARSGARRCARGTTASRPACPAVPSGGPASAGRHEYDEGDTHAEP